MLAGLYRTGKPIAGRPVKKQLQEAVLALDYQLPKVVERIEDSTDKSVRYLLESGGSFFEAVRIPLEKPGCFSVCLSSQVGCAMRCAFCATGTLGLKRNLSAAEIVGSFLAVRAEAPGRVTGAVFMGQGEPFHNYDAVIRAASLLSSPWGGAIASENITISTVGLVPQIHRYASEKHPFRVIVSLTSAKAELREKLLPIAGRWSFKELADALEALQQASQSRLTLAWVLLGGLNDTEEEVRGIKEHFGHLKLKINLIDLNSNSEQFRRATDREREHFRDALQLLEAPVVRRYSVGRESNSACGMLSLTRNRSVS
jgi:23S rRNA (adenine2503-C2)-methyltransferase